jgi:serine/threonine-protein kinase
VTKRIEWLRTLLTRGYCAGIVLAGCYGGLVEGTPFGRYRLVELLGRGGMGEVWRAFDTAIDRVVALKLLPANFADDETFKERFRREAKAAAGLDEPHVVPIHDFGEIEGRLYVTMRLIEGRDLDAVLANGPLSPPRAVRIIEQVASALHAAHKNGLVHRDVKPSNILLDEDDFSYLIDFGIARATHETALTSTGAIIGTMHYMAPERLGGREADGRSDIYALACVLYECLTGNRPFPGESLESQVAAHLTAPPPRPSHTDPNVPPAFDTVIAKGMAKNPDERYPTTKDLAQAASAAVSVPHAPPTEIDDAQRLTRAAPLPAGRSPHPPRFALSSTAPLAATRHKNRPGYWESQPAEPLKQPWWKRKSVAVVTATVAILAIAVTATAIVLGNKSSTSSPGSTTSGRTWGTGSTGSHQAAPPFDLSQCKTGADANKIVGCRIVATTNSLDAVWTNLLPGYTRPRVNLFSGQVNSGCGEASGQVGAFYCREDQIAYFDLAFFQMLADQSGSSGLPIVQEYVVAHVYGHHVQDLLGDLGRAQQGAPGAKGNGVGIELQADCYAGVWAHFASVVKQQGTGLPYLEPLSDNDIQNVLTAVDAASSDWIQKQSSGSVDQESWTYGSSAQRQHWFTVGYQTGDPKQCDTLSGNIDGP